MSSPSKVKGTRQETAICNIINDFVGTDVARRVPLHGAEDQGDIHIKMGFLKLVGESKCSKTYPSDGLIKKYKKQALTENENAGGDGGLLFINLPGRSIDRMEVWLQRSTHYKMELLRYGIQYPNDIPLKYLQKVNEIMSDSEFSWRRLTMFDFLHEYFSHPAWEWKNGGRK